MTTAHEPRGGPGVHLSAEDLSALAEGAQPSAAGAAEHLQGCAACRGEVDAISALLAQFEEWEAPAIPQDVAIRIDAALARESAARAAAADHPAAAAAASRTEAATSPGATSSTTGQSGAASSRATTPSAATARSRRRRRLPARGLAWALTAVVVVAGGLGLTLKLISSSTQGPSASSASGSAPRQPFAAPRNSNSYSPTGPLNGNGIIQGPVSANSQLALWTKQVLSKHEDTALSTAASPCQSNAADNAGRVLASADGTYDGTASTLVVYSNASDPATVLAIVYAAPCTNTNNRVLTEGLVTK